MVDLIEETFEVDVYNIIAAVMNVLLCLKNCLMSISVWTKAVAVRGEFNLEHRTDDLVNGLLQ
jgi:hypothetical protein